MEGTGQGESGIEINAPTNVRIAAEAAIRRTDYHILVIAGTDARFVNPIYFVAYTAFLD